MVSWTFYVVKLTFQKVSLKFYVVNLTFFYGQMVTFCLVNLLLFICSQLDELFIWRLMQYIAHEARNNLLKQLRATSNSETSDLKHR